MGYPWPNGLLPFLPDYCHSFRIREDKTIESAVPFPAPAKGDNRGLSPFNLGQYIALPFPENHWSVQKISPRPLPRKPGLKGVNPFSPLHIIPMFVPVPFPGFQITFLPGSPIIIDSKFVAWSVEQFIRPVSLHSAVQKIYHKKYI